MSKRLLLATCALSLGFSHLTHASCPSVDAFMGTVDQFRSIDGQIHAKVCQPLVEAAQAVSADFRTEAFAVTACQASPEVPSAVRDRLAEHDRPAIDQVNAMVTTLIDVAKLCINNYQDGCKDAYTTCRSFVSRLLDSADSPEGLPQAFGVNLPFHGDATPQNLLTFIQDAFATKADALSAIASDLKTNGFPELHTKEVVVEVVEKTIEKTVEKTVEKVIEKEVPVVKTIEKVVEKEVPVLVTAPVQTHWYTLTPTKVVVGGLILVGGTIATIYAFPVAAATGAAATVIAVTNVVQKGSPRRAMTRSDALAQREALNFILPKSKHSVLFN